MLKCLILLISLNIYSNDEGLLSSLKSQIKENKEKSNFLISKRNTPLEVNNLKDLDFKNYKYRVHPEYLYSIYLFNSESILNNIKDSKCSLYEYLATNLISHPVYKNKILLKSFSIDERSSRNILANKNIYLKHLLNKCDNAQANIQLISRNSIALLKKQTFSDLLNPEMCFSKINTLLRSNNFSYFASFALRSKKSKDTLNKIKSNFSDSEIRGFNLFSDYLSGNQNICNKDKNNISNYFNDPIVRNSFIIPTCKDMYQTRRSLTKEELNKCFLNLKKKNHYCYSHKSRYFNAVFPLQDCQTLMENLAISKYKFMQSDCPGKLSNYSMVEAARLLEIARKESKNTHCLADKLKKLIDFSEDQDLDNPWNVNLCYYNKIYKEEKCKRVIFGDRSSSLKYKNVIESILKESKLISKGSSCKLTRNKIINLGEATQSCFIQINSNSCKLNSCKFNIFINGKKINHGIETKSDINFSFFTRGIRNSSKSFLALYKSKYKITTSPIKNMTQLKKEIKKKGNFIHGIGCLEEIIPYHFPKTMISQCTPMPFLISAIKERKNKIENVLIHTSIDNFLNSREVPWNLISNSVKNLSDNISEWSLNAYNN